MMRVSFFLLFSMALSASAQEDASHKQEHVVVQGDTLWDVCEKALGSGLTWTKIWSYNPEITNAHWIYPGDLIRFYPSTQPLPNVDPGSVATKDPTEPLDEQRVEVTPDIPKPPPGSQRFLVRYYVVPKKLEPHGKITNSTSEEMMYNARDIVTLKLTQGRTARPGERYLIYRKLRRVDHPKNGRSFGHIIEVTGVVLVDSVDDHTVRGQLTEVFTEVEKGQKILPYVDPMVSVTPTSATKAVRGVVLATEEARVMVGDNQIVFVDRGREDGLERGIRLLVAKQKNKKNLGIGDIATLVVVDVKDKSATCMVVHAIRELEPGDEFHTEVN
jgi:hypothetical protein